MRHADTAQSAGVDPEETFCLSTKIVGMIAKSDLGLTSD